MSQGQRRFQPAESQPQSELSTFLRWGNLRVQPMMEGDMDAIEAIEERERQRETRRQTTSRKQKKAKMENMTMTLMMGMMRLMTTVMTTWRHLHPHRRIDIGTCSLQKCDFRNGGIRSNCSYGKHSFCFASPCSWSSSTSSSPPPFFISCTA